MLPLQDTHTSHTFPIVNYSIILLNVLIFIIQFTTINPELFIRVFGFIPAEFSLIRPSTYSSMFTSMFLHGGLLHIVSNLWFLHIFGDNVEDTFGHVVYALFYVGSGVAAVLAQYFIHPSSPIPLIGASGAIAGVTGAYFVIFKRARIEALVPSFFGMWQRVELPAWLFLGYWFILQIMSGVGSIATMHMNHGGVAFFAHIGGFIFGYVFAKIFYRPPNKLFSFR